MDGQVTKTPTVLARPVNRGRKHLALDARCFTVEIRAVNIAHAVLRGARHDLPGPINRAGEQCRSPPSSPTEPWSKRSGDVRSGPARLGLDADVPRYLRRSRRFLGFFGVGGVSRAAFTASSNESGTLRVSGFGPGFFFPWSVKTAFLGCLDVQS